MPPLRSPNKIVVLFSGRDLSAFDTWLVDLKHRRILIQSEGAEVYFRKVELHPFP